MPILLLFCVFELVALAPNSLLRSYIVLFAHLRTKVIRSVYSLLTCVHFVCHQSNTNHIQLVHSFFLRPFCVCGNVLAQICHEAAAVLCCDRLSTIAAVGAGSQSVVSCCVSSVLHAFARSWRKQMQAKLILI